MDVYLDLSYICHIITLVNIPYYFKKILNIHVTKLEFFTLLLVSIILYFNIFIFRDYPYINLLFIFLYFLVIYKSTSIKCFLLSMFVYYGNISTCILFTNKINLYKGLVFVSDYHGIWFILVQFINIIIIEIIMLSIKSIKLLKHYRIKIGIEMNNIMNEFSGYIDSGNTLIYDGRPVIFLKEKYFTHGKYDEMIVNGIGVRKCKYVVTNVIIDGKKREVICASGSNKGFNGCDCLININLMEEKNEIIR